MDHAGDELFAGAALPRQQNGDLRVRDAAHEVENPPGRRRVADEEAAGCGTAGFVQQAAVFFLEPLPLARQPFEVTPVLDRHSGETGERGQKPRVVLVERHASSAPLLLVGENERPDGPASGADRHADSRRDRRAQEPEPFPRHRARRPHHVA